MRNLLLVFLLVLLTGWVDEKPTLPAADGVYAFVNVNVVPMDEERVLEGQTVIVKDGRITEIGNASSVKIPDGATQIEGEGKYLMPGLAEMHGHIPPPSQPKEYIESVLFMYVANGITTVRGMLGHDGQLELKEKANASEIISPTLYLAGPSFSGGSVSSVDQAIEKVRRQKEEGWDLLKVHPGLTREEYDAMAKTANEVGIRFGGHVPNSVDLAHAIEMGQETFDHIDGYAAYVKGTSRPATDEAIADVVNLTVESGSWVVPTMVLWEVLYGVMPMDGVKDLPELKYMPVPVVQNWINTHRNRLANPNLDKVAGMHRIENRNKILAALNDAGARILMGTDAPQQFSVPGFSIHLELERMVEIGMTPYEVFKTGTLNVGEYFKNQDTFGLVAEGHRADLLLVNDNPLESVANIKKRSGVMTRGVWLSESDIQKELAGIEARASGSSLQQSF